jgi:hypothetical protein
VKRKALLAAILLQFTLSACRAFAAVDISCVVGYRNYVRPGEWTPVTITSRTDGEAVSGRFVVEVLDPVLPLGRYERSARVSAKPSAHVVYVMLPKMLDAKLRVRFEDRGRTLAETETTPRKRLQSGTPILLNLTEPRALAPLDGRFMGIMHTQAGMRLAGSEAAIYDTPSTASG